MKRLSIILILSVAFLGLNPSFVSAQAPGSLQVQGLAVSPFLIEANVNPGKAQDETITLTNTTGQPLPIDLSIGDFRANSATGQAQFLSAKEKADPVHELSSWITIVKQPDSVIAPGRNTQVVFRIQPPADAAPGTHYGGLLFSYRAPGISAGVAQVTQKVGVLVLARFGHGHEQGSITSFVANYIGKDQIKFTTLFFNQGNVQLKPKGEIYITNMVGGEVASVPVNRDADIVLPESNRQFESIWNSGWRFGRYTAVTTLYYGDPKIQTHERVVMWILPWQRGGVLLLGVIVALLLFYKFIAWHRRRILSSLKIRPKAK